MRALFIGGTGTISAAIVRQLVNEMDWEVWLINRGNRANAVPQGVHQITADIHDEADVLKKLGEMTFDVVGEFIGFTPEQVERDWRLFRGRTRQYIYISSASAYHKPAASHIMKKYREEGFPVTIVRPSHTYDERHIPLGVHGKNGFWQVIERMRQGKPVIIQGDGSSLWHVTFNRDFAVGYTALMGNRHAIGEAFQITGDEVLTWDQIYATIADALGVELHAYHVASEYLAAVGDKYGYDLEGNLLGDKAVCVCFDNAKLKRLAPDMKTTVPFHVGVRIALDYVMSHPEECQIPDPEFDAWCDRVIAALEAAKASI